MGEMETMPPRSAIAATLPYPERFHAAAAYAGIGRAPNSASTGAIARLPDDVHLKLRVLYYQAKSGPYAARKPNTKNLAEKSGWMRSVLVIVSCAAMIGFLFRA